MDVALFKIKYIIIIISLDTLKHITVKMWLIQHKFLVAFCKLFFNSMYNNSSCIRNNNVLMNSR